ncbi:uncharacterized protein [Procambarus clarkii]|uniref:uncharacterized protein n=1 Tax=Procambarus clarkii TaxID=6728 RepID=UPI003742F53D
MEEDRVDKFIATRDERIMEECTKAQLQQVAGHLGIRLRTTKVAERRLEIKTQLIAQEETTGEEPSQLEPSQAPTGVGRTHSEHGSSGGSSCSKRSLQLETMKMQLEAQLRREEREAQMLREERAAQLQREECEARLQREEGERQLRLEEIKAKKEDGLRCVERGLPSLPARRDDLKSPPDHNKKSCILHAFDKQTCPPRSFRFLRVAVGRHIQPVNLSHKTYRFRVGDRVSQGIILEETSIFQSDPSETITDTKQCGALNVRDTSKTAEHGTTVLTPPGDTNNLNKLISALDLQHIPQLERKRVREVLRMFPKLFATDDDQIGLLDRIEHTIPTGDHEPVYTRQRRLPEQAKKTIREECQKMLRQGVIEPSTSPWLSPVVLVRKPDGSYRFCVDYRKVNEITKGDVYPLPRIQEIIDQFAAAKYFSTLDAKSAYWAIPVAVKDREKTAFSDGVHQFQFKRMPFGLKTAPSSFQRAINYILSIVLGRHSLAYLDDVVIYSRSFDEHLRDLTETPSLLDKAGFKLNINKCTLASQKFKFLGFQVSTDGIRPDPDSCRAIAEMPRPRSARDVRRFLGAAGYFRRHIKGFASITAPLTDLVKKNAKFMWTSEHDEAYTKLKSQLITAPVLAVPDFDKEWEVHTDASGIAIGGCLMQRDSENHPHPVAYFSRKVKGPGVRYSATDKEALAVVESVRYFEPYLFQRHFAIFTDHRALTYIFKKKTKCPRMSRWSHELSAHSFQILYKPGPSHVVPDTLSRNVASVNVNVNIETIASDKMREFQMGEQRWKEIIEYLEGGKYPMKKGNFPLQHFDLQKGVLYYVNDMKDRAVYQSFDEHLRDLTETPSLLDKAGFKLNINKCTLASQKFKFLGFQVSTDGIRPDPDSCRAIAEMPRPRSARDVRRFLGAAGYFRRHIKGFASITAPLTDLVKKNAKFMWTSEHDEAYTKLKSQLITAPVLAVPDFDKEWEVHTDASGIAIGGCLMQRDSENHPHPVAYFSRKVKGPGVRYSATDKEALAVVESVRYFEPYLFQRHFAIFTDHRALTYIFKKKTKCPRMSRWSHELSAHSFQILYKPGPSHVVPDTLSRNVASVNVNVNIETIASDKMREFQMGEQRWKEIIEYLEGGKYPMKKGNFPLQHFDLQKGVLYYVNDMKDRAVYQSFDEHLRDLTETPSLLDKAGFKLNINKCTLASQKFKFLGFQVSTDGIRPDPDSCRAIAEMPRPRSARDVRRFLGAAGYFRRHIKGFASITAPLTDLVKKNAKFMWTSEHDEAYTKLKSQLITAPVLAVPDFDKEWEVHTDASGIAIGGCLMQRDSENHPHPVAYFSRKVKGPGVRYSATDKEVLAVVESVRYFEPYLFQRHFAIFTDHRALTYIFKKKTKCPRMSRWSHELSAHSFQILYKPGPSHVVPDTLSRNVASVNVNVNIETIASDKMREFQMGEQRWKEIIEYLEGGKYPMKKGNFPLQHFDLQKGVLYYVNDMKDRAVYQLVIPDVLRSSAVKLAHASKIAGHPGVFKTYMRAKTLFYFPSMLSYITKFVRSCPTCQRRKGTPKVQAPLQEFPDIFEPLDRVGADLIDLHSSHSGNRYVLVLVDHLSRFTTLVALPRKDAQTVADAFLSKFVTVFGPPKVLVSDRGQEFVGNTFKEVCKILETTTTLTTAYHPQANGMTERTNRTIKDMLAILAEKDAATWDEQLPYVQLALNTAIHQSINTQPLLLFTGRSCNFPSGLLNRHEVVYGEDYPSEILSKMRNAWRIAAEASKTARSRYAHYYDKKVQPLTLREGSLVMRLNEKAPDNQSRKLAPRWRGPYRVIKKLGPVNFLIRGIFDDQSDTTIHVNKLKCYVAKEELELPSAIPIPDPSELTDPAGLVQDGEEDLLSTLIGTQGRPCHPMLTRSRARQGEFQ